MGISLRPKSRRIAAARAMAGALLVDVVILYIEYHSSFAMTSDLGHA
jgi:hypothetical protein